MSSFSNALENRIIDGIFRGGALSSAGTVNSTAVVTGMWSAATAFVAGDVVIPHANMTGAGGKFLLCTAAGTTASTSTLAVPAVGSTLTDGSVTWTAISGCPAFLTTYVGLLVVGGQRANSTAYTVSSTASGYVWLTANDGKTHIYKCTTAGTTATAQGTLYPGVASEVITDGTAAFTEQTANLESNSLTGLEVTGGSYARVAVTASMANWAGTQSAGSTTASSGTGGTTSNNNAVTFAAPSANWGVCAVQVEYNTSTGGMLIKYTPLTVPKTVNNGDAAPSFAVAAITNRINA